MRRIIRQRNVVADDARYEGESDGDGARNVPTLAAYLAAGAGDAVVLGPADELDALLPQLTQLTLIVIEFPKVGEGRGFSLARLLRQRHGYRGELRARGALKRDQLLFLARCGFDAFDLDPAEDLQAALAALGSFTVAYQDGDESLVHVRRRADSRPATR